MNDWAGYASLLMDDYYFDSDGGVYEGRDKVVAFVSSALDTRPPSITCIRLTSPLRDPEQPPPSGRWTTTSPFPEKDQTSSSMATAGTRRNTFELLTAGACSAALRGASASTPKASTRPGPRRKARNPCHSVNATQEPPKRVRYHLDARTGIHLVRRSEPGVPLFSVLKLSDLALFSRSKSPSIQDRQRDRHMCSRIRGSGRIHHHLSRWTASVRRSESVSCLGV